MNENPNKAKRGLVARIREYADTVRDFSTLECAQALNETLRPVVQLVSREVSKGKLFAFGPKGHFQRRYTNNRFVAQEWKPKGRDFTAELQRKRYGAIFGAIRTVQDIRDRCHVEAGCLIWPGALSGPGGIPSAYVPGLGSGSLVRNSWLLANPDKSLPVGHLVWRKCMTQRCVEPEHLMSGSRADYGRWLIETGARKGLHSYINANKKRGALQEKITREIAQEIAAGTEAHRVWAFRLGVSESSVKRALRRHGLSKRPARAKPVPLPPARPSLPAPVTIAPRKWSPDIIIPAGLKVVRCPSTNYDPRYQLPPDAKVEGAGFAAVGIGRYVE
jgi:hypothetical protein